MIQVSNLGSKERCVLVSPYLSINSRLKKRIKYKKDLKKPMKIIYKEDTNEKDWLDDNTLIEIEPNGKGEEDHFVHRSEIRGDKLTCSTA